MARLICLCGSERFLIDRAVDLIKETVLVRRRATSTDTHRPGSRVARIVACARTLPMMAPRRLVLVRDVSALSANDLAGLLPYVAAPVPEACLCFWRKTPICAPSSI